MLYIAIYNTTILFYLKVLSAWKLYYQRTYKFRMSDTKRVLRSNSFVDDHFFRTVLSRSWLACLVPWHITELSEGIQWGLFHILIWVCCVVSTRSWCFCQILVITTKNLSCSHGVCRSSKFIGLFFSHHRWQTVFIWGRILILSSISGSSSD